MPERHVGLVFSAFTTDLPQLLPERQTIYVTVVASDSAGNTQEMSSNGFQVDTSHPVITTGVQLSSGVGTLDNTGLVSRDLIGVHWAFSDSQSHIASQYLSLHSHLNGEFQSSSIQVPGPLTEFKFSSLTLHDGSVYNVKITACNLAGLCTTSVSPNVLHDHSPPSTGMFAIATDHAAELTRHVDTWMQWTSNSLRLAWLGFHDQHSGVHRYLVSVGTSPFATDLNVGGSSSQVHHSHTNSTGYSYQDEGFVQVYQVSTNNLTPGQHVFVTIWAINGVGLKSHPAMSQFQLVAGGSLVLVRRCQPFNCLSHCVCAVEGGTCGPMTSCTQHSEGNNPNALLTVRDQADLSVLNTTSSVVTSSASYQASQSYLAATWHVTTSQGSQPMRYEVSAGRSGGTGPQGVFNSVTDRVWRDVGLQTSSIIVLPPDVTLTARLAYSTFVRVWYADNSYAVFKSPGIIPIVSGPTITNLQGRAVKEHSSANSNTDVDFVTSSDSIYISWAGKFVTSASINKFHLYIGTQPEAADIHTSGVLAGTENSSYVKGLSLRETTLYYSTVTAEGSSGVVTWAVSDGFLVDTGTPVHGVVMDGPGIHDVDYQSQADSVSATWHGFYDPGSGVRRYVWCVGSANSTNLCDVVSHTDVGLMTSATAPLASSVSHGTLLYSKVYAEDALGQRSEVSVSDGVRVDKTPPLALHVVYSDGVNLLDNPSFEVDTALNNNVTQCDPLPPTSWQLTAGSCVTLHRPEHVVSAKGSQHVVLSGTLKQDASRLTLGKTYRLTLRLAHPHNALANQRPVTGHVTLGHVTTPFTLDPSMCVGVCDAGHEPVMVWHRFHYIANAISSTMEVSISTATSTADQQLALDDVILEEIRTIGSSGDKSEQAVKTSGVFLTQWSVVQTSWHFAEDVSPIVDYQWALGTSHGGVQIQAFRSVGRRQHASLSGLSLTHGTHVYVTVLARNAASLTSLAYSQPLVVDMTPPEFVTLVDGDSGDDVDYQTGGVVKARWSVTDPQSSVSSCQWAIGKEPGRGDVIPFQNTNAVSPDTFSVSADVTSFLSDVTLPVTLYVSVRCYNMAGLPARKTTDGVTIVADVDSKEVTTLRLLPDGMTQYPILETCRVYGDRLRLRWGNFVSQVPVVGFEIVRSSGSGQLASQTPKVPYLLNGADLNLTSTPLAPHTSQTITVHPLTILGTVSSAGASRVTHVLPDTPSVKDSETISTTLTGTDLTLSWPDLFHSVLDLNYEVTVGSVTGGGDITLWHQTQDPSMVVSLDQARTAAFNLSVVVTAIDPCGQFAHYLHNVHVEL